MEEDLDHILLHQLDAAKIRLKRIKRMKKLMVEPRLEECEKRCILFIKYCENMIENKSLINKKINKKDKTISEDVLARNVFYEMWRNTFLITTISYRIFTNFWKKNK